MGLRERSASKLNRKGDERKRAAINAALPAARYRGRERYHFACRYVTLMNVLWRSRFRYTGACEACRRGFMLLLCRRRWFDDGKTCQFDLFLKAGRGRVAGLARFRRLDRVWKT